ncbi:nucleotidyl transferase AbiEii/AbiGii toxin family protein [Hydrogenophaga sp.]|uniref:nucleotidyl transferase AbiEii/AbiGii toxin family protein n=1 Tax=Hydrogenophaga sp. TaxID=1904254 RepID=UPI002731E83A|nr:nucleotidyl transferase AbiEii/AbiGii toxin family protein [Hydrogenophaga sp.]MDP2015620.1 nucleotidyl transferase AbiEii/AbiGii toxin family protein [Hydrogenophaga sp.]
MTPSQKAGQPASLPDGAWQTLLAHSLTLVDDIAQRGISNPFWTFGGGTVLMLRYRHRLSKDIDIFVPDPQYLGFVSPRLSQVAEGITPDYVEGPGYVKLLRPEGEIDFVASPNLTAHAYEEWNFLGRMIRVETSTEIVAKKLWHRGDRATARDLFDLSLVIEREPGALSTAATYLTRHRGVFVQQLHQRQAVLRAQFEEIQTLDYRPTYDDAVARAAAFLASLPSE